MVLLLKHGDSVRNKPIDLIKGGTWRLRAQWREASIKVLSKGSVWWTGTLGAVTAIYLLACKSFPWFLIGWVLQRLQPYPDITYAHVRYRVVWLEQMYIPWGDTETFSPSSLCSLEPAHCKTHKTEREEPGSEVSKGLRLHCRGGGMGVHIFSNRS